MKWRLDFRTDFEDGVNKYEILRNYSWASEWFRNASISITWYYEVTLGIQIFINIRSLLALRVLPVQTRLTVYRRRSVLTCRARSSSYSESNTKAVAASPEPKVPATIGTLAPRKVKIERNSDVRLPVHNREVLVSIIMLFLSWISWRMINEMTFIFPVQIFSMGSKIWWKLRNYSWASEW